MKIKISSDSTCDLSAELVERYDVHIVPLSVSKDGVFYRDGLEITPQDIFDHVSSGGGVCSTAAVNMDEYQHIFEGLRRDYDAVIHFTISSELSCCYQNACLAPQEVPGVYVIDAENLSTGIGQLVLEASIMAREGAAPEEIPIMCGSAKGFFITACKIAPDKERFIPTNTATIVRGSLILFKICP